MDHGPNQQNHRNRHARTIRALLGAAALGAGLLLAGCDSESGSTPATPAPVAPPAPTDPVTEPVPPPGKDTPAAFTRWYVETAIALYEAEGLEAAVAAYSDPASVDGPWYLGIADEQGIIIANPSPEAVGLSLRGALGVDSSGKDFGNEIMTVTEEGLWVDYKRDEPRQRGPGSQAHLGDPPRRADLRLRLVRRAADEPRPGSAGDGGRPAGP